MNFGERHAQRQREKDLKNELKSIRKTLIDAGCDKNTATKGIKEFSEALECGAKCYRDYKNARGHMERATEQMENMLLHMGARGPQQQRQSLAELSEELAQVCDVSLVRPDDADFLSTRDCLKRMSAGNELEKMKMSEIMLRSELENLLAVFADVATFEPPDFFALAWYLGRESGETLKEMENAQRNGMLLEYRREHFENEFLIHCNGAGVSSRLIELMEHYIYEDVWET